MGLISDKYEERLKERIEHYNDFKYWFRLSVDILFILFVMMYFNYMKTELRSCKDIWEQYFQDIDYEHQFNQWMNYSNISEKDFVNLTVEEQIKYNQLAWKYSNNSPPMQLPIKMRYQ